MNEAYYDNMHRRTFSRVAENINNIGRVNRMEAFDICMAHTRCFGQLVANMCDSNEEFELKLRELFSILLTEGLKTREASLNAKPR